MNMGSLEIFCFDCGQEIFDENLRNVKSKEKPLIDMKNKVRGCLKSAVQRAFSRKS